ncbi:hypothetical protein VNO77_02093 [Canavalia gladiata]|uniref:Uncharacterized protein n=1 Tax=Canavalia gladiata TaxID=3824 RepID=A0AAN9MSZ6_CANGL
MGSASGPRKAYAWRLKRNKFMTDTKMVYGNFYVTSSVLEGSRSEFLLCCTSPLEPGSTQNPLRSLPLVSEIPPDHAVLYPLYPPLVKISLNPHHELQPLQPFAKASGQIRILEAHASENDTNYLMSSETEHEDSSTPSFTITVDAKYGTSTEVSTTDKAKTIVSLSSPKSKSQDFRKPGNNEQQWADWEAAETMLSLRQLGHNHVDLNHASN